MYQRLAFVLLVLAVGIILSKSNVSNMIVNDDSASLGKQQSFSIFSITFNH